MPDHETQDNDLSFETAMSRLDDLLKKLDAGNLPLEELTRTYEEGDKLVKYCRKLLAGFERRIEILAKDDGSGGQWRDFSDENE